MYLKPDLFCLSAESQDMDFCISHYPQVCVQLVKISGSPQGSPVEQFCHECSAASPPARAFLSPLR